MPELLLATGNPNKIKEFKHHLSSLPFNLLDAKSMGLSLDEETGQSYFENACIKAIGLAKKTKRMTLADDSGLELDLLGSRPGIYSARFSKPNASDIENNRYLIEQIHQHGGFKKPVLAKYVCVLVLASKDGVLAQARGEISGQIIEHARGEHGFGYDPHFFVPSINQTLAQASFEIKASIDHRACAFELLLPYLKELLQK